MCAGSFLVVSFYVWSAHLDPCSLDLWGCILCEKCGGWLRWYYLSVQGRRIKEVTKDGSAIMFEVTVISWY
jgi:hypothetical protein